MLFNLEDWENIIHFGNLFASIGKKTYFLALGTTPVTGVGFIARKITDTCKVIASLCIISYLLTSKNGWRFSSAWESEFSFKNYMKDDFTVMLNEPRHEKTGF